MVAEAVLDWSFEIPTGQAPGGDALLAAYEAGFEPVVLSPDKYAAFKKPKSEGGYYDDPAGFARECIEWDEEKGEGLADYQAEILGAIMEKKRVSVRGARGLGKSFMLAIVVLWFALTRDGEDWKIILTASKWFQLANYLWPEIHKWARKIKWEKVGREPLSRNELLMRTIKLETGATSTSSPDKPGGIEGAHAECVLFIFDESKNVKDEVFDSAEGTFSGAGPDTGREAFVLAFSTPGEPVGRFSEIHHRKAGLENWWPRHVRVWETVKAGRVSAAWVLAMARLWGKDSPLYKNHVLGEFAATDANVVIPLAWVEAAHDRWRELYEEGGSGHPGPLLRVGIDVGGGGDDTVLAVRYGNAISRLYPSKESDHVVIAADAARIMGERERSIAVVDVVGIGSGVHSILRSQGYRSVPFGGGDGTNRMDRGGMFGFPDKRSAGWWHLRELLDPRSGEELALPPDDRLTAELITPRWKERPGKRFALIQVESKDSLKGRLDGKSTDYADAVMQAFWPELPGDVAKQKRKVGAYASKKKRRTGRRAA